HLYLAMQLRRSKSAAKKATSATAAAAIMAVDTSGKRYARIEAMPTSGLIGAWTIGDSTYLLTVQR
ncbi:MAG: hypothetical protein ACK47M_22625, partial [Caldilinea sp.]